MTFRHLRRPDAQGRKALVVAAVIWLGVLWGLSPSSVVIGGMVLIVGGVATTQRRPFLIACLVLAAGAGVLASARVQRTVAATVGSGPVQIQGVLMADPVDDAALFRVEATNRPAASGTVLLRTPHQAEAGDRLRVAGMLTDNSGFWRGSPYAGVLTAHRVEEDLGPSTRWFGAANAVRGRIGKVYDRVDHRGAPLVRGFLIGDTSQLPATAIADLRRAGLSHYVAVSGSNVALFLALVWIVMGPLAFSIRLRAIFGVAALVVFTLITRWEASVLRAGFMAALVLGARSVGFPLTAWGALGSAVTGLLLVSPGLATSAGFQLSVAATLGVMAGADLFPSIGIGAVRRSLAAAVGAQVAVAPVLLGWFGSVPLVSPIANLLAAPFVALATATGGIAGLTGITSLAQVASAVAAVVLEIAAAAARGPQVGPLAAAGIAVVLIVPRRSLQVVIGFCVAAVMVLGSVGSRLPANTIAFLDVGQGDAAVVRAGDGSVLLIDGGPDPDRILEHLDRYGIDRIDLMLLSHPDDDHAVGLVAAAGSRTVGTLWHPGFLEGGPTFDALLETLGPRTVVDVPAPGDQFLLGDLTIEVIGPMRRYQSTNNQSLVVRIASATISILLPGDIETVAQRDLGPLKADVLMVPHHGAATTDLRWLAASAPPLAVVSVGTNTFGHPSAEVIETLRANGAQVLRTDESGTVVVRLDVPVADQLVGAGSGKS